MKIIFLNGGLANQVFQYIFYRNATLLHPEEDWYLDDSFFFVHKVHNGYELNKVFGLKPKLLSEFFDADVWEYMIELKRSQNKSIPQQLMDNHAPLLMIAEESNHTKWNPFTGHVELLPESGGYHPEILSLPGNIYYHGYWINQGYYREFQSVFLKELAFSNITDEYNLKLFAQINHFDSVSVHIRRGDYVSLGVSISDKAIHTAIKSITQIIQNSYLFVFSDDPDYCHTHTETLGLKLAQKYIIVEGNRFTHSYRDLHLMSHCKNMIISNSAFCFLAALLNRNLTKVVNLSSRSLDYE